MFKSKGGADMYLEIYYLAYFGLCAMVCAGLAWTLRRFGTAFLRETFRDRLEALHALFRLFDVGFYLAGAGYALLTFWAFPPLGGPSVVAHVIIMKLGGLLLLLGFAHILNLGILALFRQPSARVARGGDLL